MNGGARLIEATWEGLRAYCNLGDDTRTGGGIVVLGTDATSGGGLPERGTRDVGLVRLSLLLAVCLEVVPVEIDTVGFLLSNRLFVLAAAMKVVFLTAILLPLAIYVLRNGFVALTDVRRRAALIGVIVGINLALNLSTALRHLWR